MQPDLAALLGTCLKAPRQPHPVFDSVGVRRDGSLLPEANLVPHKECIHLDRVFNGDHVLTNMLTLESKVLQPAGEW